MPTLQTPSVTWFDGHLDLAFLHLHGREMRAESPDSCGGDFCPAAVTLPAMRNAGIRRCLGTVFTAPDLGSPTGVPSPAGYPADDNIDGARAAGVRQLAVYQKWMAAGELRLLGTRNGVAENGWKTNLEVILLMEGADPIRDEKDAHWWFGQGLRVVGLAWAKGTRYSAGNASPGPLTHAGRSILRTLNNLGMIMDLSHLPDQAAWEVLEQSQIPPVASHSNCRRLMDGVNERHLSDDLIRAIGGRGGIIGLNLFSRFLTMEPRRARMEEVLAHLDHMAQILGSTRNLALGSDMDGGFTADQLPEGMNHPADLRLLEEGLRGGLHWTEAQIASFKSGNWNRFLGDHLPLG